MEASMKRDPRRCQPDLFDSDLRPLPILASLQEELVDLLSQLLWQVTSAQTVANQESSDEQDRA
jgi:hypothetical protein